ncbi:MAG: hypothetical protein ACYDDF_08675 [Thermoplasmatota archaeon]
MVDDTMVNENETQHKGTLAGTHEKVGKSLDDGEPGARATAGRLQEQAGTAVEAAKANVGQRAENARRTFQNSSPDELRAKARDLTGKATAQATGALEGFAQQADPAVVRDAAQKATRTATEAVKGVKEEVDNARESDASGSHKTESPKS